MRTFLYILLVLTGFSYGLSAQGLLLWHSDPNSSPRESTDIWLRPDDSAGNAMLEIYDGDAGGDLDRVRENSQVVLTWSLYQFEDLYTLENGLPVLKDTKADPLSSLRTVNAAKYDGKWTDMFELRERPQGYILRYTGPDIPFEQLFGLRIKENRNWKILSHNLKVAMIASDSGQVFQVRPDRDAEEDIPPLSIENSGNIRTWKISEFGDTTGIAGTRFPDSFLGSTKRWALNISSLSEGIHLMDIRTQDGSPLLWIYDPLNPAPLNSTRAELTEAPGSACTEKIFDIKLGNIPDYALQNTRWYLNGQEATTGELAALIFDRRGPNEIMTITPNPDDALLPGYLIRKNKVFVNTPPVAEVDIPKKEAYTSEKILISALNSFDPEGKELSYRWYINGQPEGEEPVFIFSKAEPGNYRLRLEVSDPGSDPACSRSEYSSTIRVTERTVFDIDTPLFTDPDSSIRIQALIPVGLQASDLDLQWSGSALIAGSNRQQALVDASRPGNYELQLKATILSTGETFTVDRNFRVTSAPEPVIKVPEIVAPGQAITLDGSSSESNTDTPLSYEWKVNGVVVANTAVATLNLTRPGDYTVELTVDDGLGLDSSTATASQNLHVNSPPKPVLQAPRISANPVVTFDASQSTDAETDKLQYRWEIGEDKAEYTGAVVTHRFESGGRFPVTLIVDDGSAVSNAEAVIEQEILINRKPVADFTLAERGVPGQRIRLDGTGSYDPDGEIYSYEWFLNGKLIAVGSRASLTLNEAGEQILSLKVTDNSGDPDAVSLLSREINVNAPPVPRYKVSVREVEPNEEVIFDASGSSDPDGEIVSYTWEFEDGITLDGVSVSRTFDTPGDKKFQLTVDDGSGLPNAKATINASTNINNAPSLVTETQIFSNSLDVSLDASSSYDLDNDPLSVTWTLPDGTQRNEFQFTWKAPGPGIHIISLSIDDGRGLPNSSRTEMIRVLINRPVNAEVDSLITACSGKPVLFNSSDSFDPDGDPYTVNWDFGDGGSSNEPNPAYTYSKPGVYEAEVSFSDGISKKETVARIPVIIEGSPYAQMNMRDTTICVNTLLELDATGSSDPSGTLPALTWEMGDGTIQSGLKTQHIYTEPGTYTLSLVAEGSGSGACGNISQVSAEVRVIEGPQATFDVPEWVTPGDQIVLDASRSTSDIPIERYEWTIDSDSTQYLEYGERTEHTFLEAGEYFVTLNVFTTGAGGCNSVSLTKTVKVNAAPLAEWNVPDNIAAGEDLLLDATGSTDRDGYITSYRWYLDDQLLGTNVTEILNLTETGRRNLRLEIRDNATASNNTTVLEKEIYINAAPEAIISFGDRKVTLNDRIPLNYSVDEDADGDPVQATWLINGKAYDREVLSIDRLQAYAVKLKVDDGRGASNSVDSAMVILNPGNLLPKLKPDIPEKILQGKQIRIADIGLDPEVWRFYQNNSLREEWTADDLNSDQIIIRYVPERRSLYESSYSIEVLPSLAFTEENSEQIRTFNPLNPEVIIEAPGVNREIDQVRVKWYRGDELIGNGPLLSFTPEPGLNTIRVVIEDYKVYGGESLSRELRLRFTR